MNVMRAVTAAVSVVWSLIGLALAGVAEQAPASAGPDRGMLAVLRRDGMLVPFAAFKGNDWSTPWPVDLQYKELPINLESVPAEWWGGRAPTGWHVRLITGADQPIKVMAPAPYTAHCAPRLGLRSDYRPSEPIRRGQSDPFPKDGLAATDGVPIDPIEIIDRSSPEAAQLVTALAADFNRAEDRMASDLRAATRWKHPFDKEVREKTTVRIEAWYRSPMLEPGYSVSYIEAVRTYPIQPEDDGCPLETTFSGWIEHDPRDATPKARLSARIAYCDRPGAMYMLPLGRLRVAQQMYWVFQYAGWNEEWYEVVRIAPKRTRFVVEFYAGGLRGCGY